MPMKFEFKQVGKCWEITFDDVKIASCPGASAAELLANVLNRQLNQWINFRPSERKVSEN